MKHDRAYLIAALDRISDAIGLDESEHHYIPYIPA